MFRFVSRTILMIVGFASCSQTMATPQGHPLATAAAPSKIFKLQLRKLAPLDALQMEYSDEIAITYPIGVDLDAFKSGLTVSPSTAIDATYPFIQNAGVTYHIAPHAAIGLRLRFEPGVTYTIRQPDFGVNLRVATPPLTNYPAPIRQIKNSPYYYGFLNHPWAFAGFIGGVIYDTKRKQSDASLSAIAGAKSTLAAIAQSGAGYVRMDFCSNQTISPTYPEPKWRNYDPVIKALADINVTVLPIIQQHCPAGYMHYAGPGGSGTVDTPEHYAEFATAVATHMKIFPNVTRVELFNEPNLRGGWRPGTPEFADLYGGGAAPYMKQAYAAVKAANSNLMVVAGALATGGHHVDARKWMDGVMTAGCKVRVCWDEISVHNYRWASPASATIETDPMEENRLDIYKDIQNVAIAHGDPKPKVMLTEWGYSTCATLTLCFDPKVQALYLAQGLNMYLADPSVDGVTYVNIYNSSNDHPDFFWSSTALLNNDWSPKPGFTVFQKFAAGSH